MFEILLIVSTLAFWVGLAGLIYPKLIRMSGRKSVLLTLILPSFILSIVALVNLPERSTSDEPVSTQSNTSDTQSGPDRTPPADLSLAQPYEVVKFDRYDMPNRTRGRWSIRPTKPLSVAQIIPTASKAAIDLQRTEHMQVADVFLYGDEAGKSEYFLAIVGYTFDGLGNSGDTPSLVWSVDIPGVSRSAMYRSIYNEFFNFENKAGFKNADLYPDWLERAEAANLNDLVKLVDLYSIDAGTPEVLKIENKIKELMRYEDIEIAKLEYLQGV